MEGRAEHERDNCNRSQERIRTNKNFNNIAVYIVICDLVYLGGCERAVGNYSAAERRR